MFMLFNSLFMLLRAESHESKEAAAAKRSNLFIFHTFMLMLYLQLLNSLFLLLRFDFSDDWERFALIPQDPADTSLV